MKDRIIRKINNKNNKNKIIKINKIDIFLFKKEKK